MPDVDLLSNRVVVLAAALIYWGGVFVQTRRVRRMIGRQPNVKPRGTKEHLLWAGWFLVVVGWLVMPFAARTNAALAGFRLYELLLNDIAFWLGIFLTIVGYAGTLWCYGAMGGTWRMGVDRAEKTALVSQGPFHFVRHPIYIFQVVMLAGTVFLLPTPISALALAVHVICILCKASDEEDYLRTVHGAEWDKYLSHTGRFLPKLRFRSKT
jgi:protein-S-isoprenylcysteine O-methyltransferase Ste14